MTVSLSYRNIHPDFHLNGVHYDFEDLKEVAYSLIKEGEEHECAIGDFLLDWLSETPSITVKTSGSTGKPKGICLQKKHMVNSAIATGDFFTLRSQTKALLCLSAEYIAGKMMLVRAMVLGWHLDYVAPASKPLNAVSTSYDFGAMVPMQLENSISKIEQIKTVIVGGAQVSRALSSKVVEKQIDVFETYGMTETITHVALKRLSGAQANFKALPEVSFTKDDRNCLVVSAPKIIEEPITTNDMVELVSDTEFMWLGRYDNIINSGGIKLIPEEIERKLANLIPVRFFVSGIPDKTLGEKLILLLEGDEDSILKQRIASNDVLSKYEMPKVIYFVKEFIETGSGKINRIETIKSL